MARPQRIPDAVQRSSRCSAEPGPTAARRAWTPDQQRTTPQERRTAQHPGHAKLSNPSSRPLPMGIAQAALENLAGILARQLVKDFDMLRHLVVGQRSLELRADVGD